MFLPQKHGDGFFTVSNEPTDLPVHIIICTIVWTATSSQPLYLATASLLRTTSIASKLNTADSMLWPPYTWRSCLVDQGATMWYLFLLERLNCPHPWKSQCSNYGRKYVLLSKKSGTAFRSVLDLQQLHIPWDPGGLSMCEQTAA